MKRRARFTFLVSLLLLSTGASAQLERFIGTWAIRKSPTTGKVNLSVNIVQSGNTISGTVTFFNPDGTTTEWPITHTEFKGIRLDFETLDHDAIMQWSLTLTDAKSGFLRGDRGELLIEEKVRRKR